MADRLRSDGLDCALDQYESALGHGEPMAKTDSLIPIERIVSQIYLIRGEKVMLDSDLAVLYGVETKSLNKAVTRNRRRFPDDFMFPALQ